MEKIRKPPVKIFIASEVYNTLMYILEDFNKRYTDLEWISDKSATLKRKIEHYGRAVKTDGGENAAICFFENEAADLITLLLFELYKTTPQDDRFFERLKENKR